MQVPKLPEYLQKGKQAQAKKAQKTKGGKTVKKKGGKKAVPEQGGDDDPLDPNLVDPDLVDPDQDDKPVKKGNVDVDAFQDLVDVVHQKVSHEEWEETMGQVRNSFGAIHMSIDRLKNSITGLTADKFLLMKKQEQMEELV